MEFKFSVNEIFRQPIVRLGSNMLPPGFTGDRRAFWDIVGKVSEIVNAMGEASAAAQGLTKPITTADRLRNSEHTLYLLIDQNAANGRGAVTGMLKTGKKGLYVFDRNGQHYQVSPPCVLDFYIHESRQRTGLGKRLFEHMLEEEKIEPVKMAIDRPSDKFLGFLNKHYSLNSPVKQMNNYVVFDDFFPSTPEKNGAVEVQAHSGGTPGKKQSANGLQTTSYASPMGRYGAPRPPCSMGQIIHNQTSTIPKNTEPTGVVNARSAGDMNYQGIANDRNPNMTQSTPNMYYQPPAPYVKFDGLGPNSTINYESDKNTYYEQQQQQNYGNANTVDDSNQMAATNTYPQATTQQQNVTPFQQQEVMQNQYNMQPQQQLQSQQHQTSQFVAATPSNVQNPGLATNQIVAQQTEVTYIPNLNQQETYNAQNNTQNLQQSANQVPQNVQQYPPQYLYSTPQQTMQQPILQQQIPHLQNQVPIQNQNVTLNESFPSLVAPANAQQMSYVPEVLQSNPQYTPTDLNQYQYNVQVQQQNLQNNAQYTYGPTGITAVPPNPQTVPTTYTLPQNSAGYTMPTAPYHAPTSSTQVPQYAASATMQYPLVSNAGDAQYNNQLVQNQPNQLLQPNVVTNPALESNIAMTTQVPQTVSMTNQIPSGNLVTSQIQPQPTIFRTNQSLAQSTVPINMDTVSQHQIQNMAQVSQPVMPNEVTTVAPNLSYSVPHIPNVPQPTVNMTQPNVMLTSPIQGQQTMTSQPNITNQTQYPPQNMMQYGSEQRSPQPALRADVNPTTANNPKESLPQLSTRRSRLQNEAFQYNYNPAMTNTQNVAVPPQTPQARGESARVRNPQFSIVNKTDVQNEPQSVYHAQGDVENVDDGLKFGYPSQVRDPLKQVMTTNMISVNDR
ncbi:uncharacterized protein LOC135128051 [Zophobas morio]|uniref:uncharacterized protein LOC135128051 n=1 Tax=Zophobas morio TaxID=2755281 RepID=UPI003082A5DB